MLLLNTINNKDFQYAQSKRQTIFNLWLQALFYSVGTLCSHIQIGKKKSEYKICSVHEVKQYNSKGGIK